MCWLFYDEGVACVGRATTSGQEAKRKRDDQGQEKEDSHDPDQERIVRRGMSEPREDKPRRERRCDVSLDDGIVLEVRQKSQFTKWSSHCVEALSFASNRLFQRRVMSERSWKESQHHRVK